MTRVLRPFCAALAVVSSLCGLPGNGRAQGVPIYTLEIDLGLGDPTEVLVVGQPDFVKQRKNAGNVSLPVTFTIDLRQFTWPVAVEAMKIRHGDACGEYRSVTSADDSITSDGLIIVIGLDYLRSLCRPLPVKVLENRQFITQYRTFRSRIQETSATYILSASIASQNGKFLLDMKRKECVGTRQLCTSQVATDVRAHYKARFGAAVSRIVEKRNELFDIWDGHKPVSSQLVSMAFVGTMPGRAGKDASEAVYLRVVVDASFREKDWPAVKKAMK